MSPLFNLDAEVSAARTTLENRLAMLRETFSREVANSHIIEKFVQLAARSKQNGFDANVHDVVSCDLSSDGSVIFAGPFLEMNDYTWWHYQYCVRYGEKTERFVNCTAGMRSSKTPVETPDDLIAFVVKEVARLETMKRAKLGNFAHAAPMEADSNRLS